MQDQPGASSGGSERPPTYDELVAENERLRERLAEVERRIAELERLLEEVRRAAKRQSAPFSRNKPKEEHQVPGRGVAVPGLRAPGPGPPPRADLRRPGRGRLPGRPPGHGLGRLAALRAGAELRASVLTERLFQ